MAVKFVFKQGGLIKYFMQTQKKLGSIDFYQDVLSHDLNLIVSILNDINKSKALKWPKLNEQTNISLTVPNLPFPLSIIKKISNDEIYKSNNKNLEITKEASVILSFLAKLFIQDLVIRSMFYLPTERLFVDIVTNLKKENENPESDSDSSIPFTFSNNIETSDETDSISINSLEIKRKDIQRALVKTEEFDFLVLNGFADQSQIKVDSGSKNHLGYWKTQKRLNHQLNLSDGTQIQLNLLTNKEHIKYTLWNDNQDLKSSFIEFYFQSLPNLEEATIKGHIQLGNISLIANNKIALKEILDKKKIPFFFDQKDLIYERISGFGFISFPENDHTSSLQTNYWGSLILEINFNLGSTGAILNVSYLCIPSFSSI